MRYIVVAALATVFTGNGRTQPIPRPTNELTPVGAYFRLEVLGWLWVSEQIDADPKALQEYSRSTGIDIGLAPGYNLARSFELFLGDPDLVKAAKPLHRKWVIIEGDLHIVHGPTELMFGHGAESLGQTYYSHAKPRYVIKVRRLTAAPAGAPNAEKGPYVRMEINGVLNTNGTNPKRRDLSANRASPGGVMRGHQCNIHLYFGDDDKWLARAKELHGKAAIARGELIMVGRNPLDMERQTKPFGLLAPLPFYLLNISDLRAAPSDAEKPGQKK